MKDHFHSDVVFVILAGVSAIVVINLTRLAVAPLATRDDWMGKLGRAIGGLVTYGGA